jgi:hypothetical protein
LEQGAAWDIPTFLGWTSSAEEGMHISWLILSPIRVLIAQRLQITMKAIPIGIAVPKVVLPGEEETA